MTVSDAVGFDIGAVPGGSAFALSAWLTLTYMGSARCRATPWSASRRPAGFAPVGWIGELQKSL